MEAVREGWTPQSPPPPPLSLTVGIGQVTVTRQGKLITTLEQGKYFGELSILLGKRLCQVRKGWLVEGK